MSDWRHVSSLRCDGRPACFLGSENASVFGQLRLWRNLLVQRSSPTGRIRNANLGPRGARHAARVGEEINFRFEQPLGHRGACLGAGFSNRAQRWSDRLPGKSNLGNSDSKMVCSSVEACECACPELGKRFCCMQGHVRVHGRIRCLSPG